MISGVNRVFYELKVSGKLPSPDGVGMQILQLTQQEDCGLDEITRVVRSDPALTGRILKVANSLTSSGAPTATPLEEAVLRIGFASLRDLVLGFSLVSNNPKSVCRGFDYEAFWHLSLGRAVAAQYLTEVSGVGTTSESYVCGLLCGMGRLGLAAAHPERYGALLEDPEAADPDTLAALESRAFGINHRELTQALLRDWGFPDRLARAAAAYQEKDREEALEHPGLRVLRRTLNFADRISTQLDRHPSPSEPCPDLLKQNLLEAGVEETRIGCTLTAIRTTWREWGALLAVAAPKVSHRSEDRPAATRVNGHGVVSGAADETPPPGRGGLMLLEADDRLAAWLENGLRPAGHPIVRARTVRDALTLAVTQAPQIVVAHGQSDETEALGLCRALRSFEAGQFTYFILATRHRDPRTLHAAFDVGVDDYLILPGAEGDGLLRLRTAQRVLQLRSRLAAQEKALQQNLADLAVANRKLHRTAMTDALTQLPNRRFADEALSELWKAASETDGELSLIVADIDRFKNLNDDHGHVVGDLVLARVAALLRNQLRADDLACRMGGEEFLILCPGTPLAGGRACAERLRERVSAAEVEIGGNKVRVTLSLGLSSRRGPGGIASTAQNLLRAADDACYDSKRAGRNRVSIRPAA